MEETQVLDAESKAAPLQSPEPIEKDTGSPVLSGITDKQISSGPTSPVKGNIYDTKKPVVEEKDHASDIVNNMGNYDYDSAVDQSKDPTVKTKGVVNGIVTPETEWTSENHMDKQWKMDGDDDYSWNKIAAERSQYTYDQEATQVQSEYTKSMQEIKQAGAAAMEAYFMATYGDNQTADKMGWQGGQVTSTEAKTAFLKMSTAADMYSKFELQKYGFESQLSVARMYAEANMEKLALELYNDAINRAESQAAITGYYISPEASEIMIQRESAQKILDDPKSTQEEKNRANKIISSSDKYFEKMGFDKDENGKWAGVETLSKKEHEEQKRANKENERLQQDANDIADQTRKDNNYWNQQNYQLSQDSFYETVRHNKEIEQQNKTSNIPNITDKKGTNYPGYIKSGNNIVSIQDPVVRTEDGKTYCYGMVDGKAHKMEYDTSKSEWKIIK